MIYSPPILLSSGFNWFLVKKKKKIQNMSHTVTTNCMTLRWAVEFLWIEEDTIFQPPLYPGVFTRNVDSLRSDQLVVPVTQSSHRTATLISGWHLTSARLISVWHFELGLLQILRSLFWFSPHPGVTNYQIVLLAFGVVRVADSWPFCLAVPPGFQLLPGLSALTAEWIELLNIPLPADSAGVLLDL